MPYPHPFLRLVVGGDLYSDQEQWTWSLSLIPDNGEQGPSLGPEVPEAVIAACESFHSTPGLISQNARLRWIKLNEIGEDGRYTSADTRRWDDTEGGTPGANGGNIAPQIALAVTLRTAVNRGLASRGRFYVPVPGWGPTTDGRLSAETANFYTVAATELLNDLNAALPLYRVGVVSDRGAGASRPVTYVEVGRVLDTIRSRRTSMPEDHVAGVPLLD